VTDGWTTGQRDGWEIAYNTLCVYAVTLKNVLFFKYSEKYVKDE